MSPGPRTWPPLASSVPRFPVRALPRLLYKSGLWISADERELIATIVVRAESDLALVE